MLGRTAGSLYWMLRYLERMENTARLIEAGFQIALTRGADETDIWRSLIVTAGVKEAYQQKYDDYSQSAVVDYLLRDKSHLNSARSMLEQSRDNARTARTYLSSEIWKAINNTWLDIDTLFKAPIKTRDLPSHLETIRSHSQQVRGAMHGSMLRNDIYAFQRLGNFIERVESTSRILDVKYHVLLPSITDVGSSIDNVQWEIILRSVSGFDSYRWLNQGVIKPSGIVDFLILDKCFPRSIAHCLNQIHNHLTYINNQYKDITPSSQLAKELRDYLNTMTVDSIIAAGLHDFLIDVTKRNGSLATQIETDYRFYG